MKDDDGYWRGRSPLTSDRKWILFPNTFDPDLSEYATETGGLFYITQNHNELPFKIKYLCLFSVTDIHTLIFFFSSHPELAYNVSDGEATHIFRFHSKECLFPFGEDDVRDNLPLEKCLD